MVAFFFESQALALTLYRNFSKACMQSSPSILQSLHYRLNYLLWFGVALLLLSCAEKKTEALLKTSVPLDFATGFKLYQGEGFWEIEVNKGYAGSSETYRYLVLDSGVQVNSANYDAVIPLPITQVVLTSTTQVPHLDALGQTDLLVGFPQLDLISSRAARQRIAAGKVKDLGSGPSANPELVLDLQPDWIMISTLGEDLRYLEVFKQAGLPALINGEYVEQNPLGRAEWIKFTGVLLGNYEEASAQFEQIKKDYHEAAKLASSIPDKNKARVLSGVMYQDIWYAPSADSWAAQLLSQAGQTTHLKKMQVRAACNSITSTCSTRPVPLRFGLGRPTLHLKPRWEFENRGTKPLQLGRLGNCTPTPPRKEKKEVWNTLNWGICAPT